MSLRHVKKILLFAFILLCLFSASVIVYFYFLTPPYWDKTFGQLDERFYFAPQAFFLDVSLRNGEFPLWNPLSYCGMPFAADPQSSACYPPHLLRSILTPAYDPFATTVSIHILRFLHLLWAGLGVVLLCRLYKLSIPASLVGAFAFMFNAFNIIYFTEFFVYSLVIVWAPWVLWAAKRAFLSKKREDILIYSCLAVLFFALSTLAGFPQLSLYLGLLLAFFGMLDVLLHLKVKISVDALKQAIRLITLRMVILLGIAVFTVLAACVLLLPAFELGSNSARVVASGLTVSAPEQNFNWLHLLKCIVFFPGNTWLPLGPRAAGIGALLAAVVALGHQKRRDVWVFLLLYLIMTDCTLGPPFPIGALLHHFDFLNITVSPWRAGSFASFPFAMVAAFGIDAAGQAPLRCWKRFFKMVILIIAGAVMLTMLHFWLEEALLHPKWYFVWMLPFCSLLVMCCFCWLPWPTVGRWAIALLVAAEIIVWSAQMLPVYVSKRVAHSIGTNGFCEHERIACTNRRYGDVRPNWNMFTLNFTMTGYNPLYIGDTRQTLCRKSYESFYRGYLKKDDVLIENHRGNLFLKRSFWLARQWVSGELPGKEDVFPAATTVFLTDVLEGAVLPVPEIARKDLPKKAISKNTETVDLGRISKRSQSRHGNSCMLRLPQFEQDFKHSVLYVGYIGSGAADFKPACKDENGRTRLCKRVRTYNTRGKEAFLEIPLPDCKTNSVQLTWPTAVDSRVKLTQAYVLQDKDDEDSLITIQDWTANKVFVTVKDLPEPRLLVFMDSYYKEWLAWVDENPVEILKANDAFKAVVVPAGTHTIVFSFWSETTRIGLILSLSTFFALFCCLTAIGIWKFHNRESVTVAE